MLKVQKSRNFITKIIKKDILINNNYLILIGFMMVFGLSQGSDGFLYLNQRAFLNPYHIYNPTKQLDSDFLHQKCVILTQEETIEPEVFFDSLLSPLSPKPRIGLEPNRVVYITVFINPIK